MGFSCGSAGKELTCNVGDLGLIPGLGRSPGEGNSYPLQYSGLENPMDCIIHGVTKSWTWHNIDSFYNLWKWDPQELCLGTPEPCMFLHPRRICKNIFHWQYLRFLPPNNVHYVNASSSRICLLKNIYYWSALWEAQMFAAKACVLKELAKWPKGKKKKEKCNWGSVCIQTLRSASSGKFNNSIPKLIVNNFPALKALCPCWAWINDFSTKYWIRRIHLWFTWVIKKNGSDVRMSSLNSEKPLSLFLSVNNWIFF